MLMVWGLRAWRVIRFYFGLIAMLLATPLLPVLLPQLWAPFNLRWCSSLNDQTKTLLIGINNAGDKPATLQVLIEQLAPGIADFSVGQTMDGVGVSMLGSVAGLEVPGSLAGYADALSATLDQHSSSPTLAALDQALRTVLADQLRSAGFQRDLIRNFAETPYGHLRFVGKCHQYTPKARECEAERIVEAWERAVILMRNRALADLHKASGAAIVFSRGLFSPEETLSFAVTTSPAESRFVSVRYLVSSPGAAVRVRGSGQPPLQVESCNGLEEPRWCLLFHEFPVFAWGVVVVVFLGVVFSLPDVGDLSRESKLAVFNWALRYRRSLPLLELAFAKCRHQIRIELWTALDKLHKTSSVHDRELFWLYMKWLGSFYPGRSFGSDDELENTVRRYVRELVRNL